MNYYYADSTNQAVGPIPLERLNALAREGIIGPDTHVLPEGSDEWQQYRSISPPLPPSSRSLVSIGLHGAIVEARPPQPLAIAATKTCPFCAEPIAAAAKKCKHCGETLDVALRAAEEAKRANHQPNVYMNSAVGGAPLHKHNFPHLLHFIVTLFSVGVWLPIWVLHYIGRDRNYYW